VLSTFRGALELTGYSSSRHVSCFPTGRLGQLRSPTQERTARQRRYAPELRSEPSGWWPRPRPNEGITTNVARQLGIGPESVHNWVHQAAVDTGDRVGLRIEERLRMKELERGDVGHRRGAPIGVRGLTSRHLSRVAAKAPHKGSNRVQPRFDWVKTTISGRAKPRCHQMWWCRATA
jgi:transposase-like protein